MFPKLLRGSRLLLPRTFAGTALFASFDGSAAQNPEEITELDRALEKQPAERAARRGPAS